MLSKEFNNENKKILSETELLNFILVIKMFSICKKLMSTGNITCFIFLYLKYCKGFLNKNTTLPTYDALCMFISLLINLCSFNLVCFSFEMRGKNIFNNFLCILISYSRELKPKKSRRLRFFLQI